MKPILFVLPLINLTTVDIILYVTRGELMEHRLVVLFNRLHRVSVADVEVVFQEGLMRTIIGYEQDQAVCASSLILDTVA
jgi:hypothetical protein